jgi:hypothetical protein
MKLVPPLLEAPETDFGAAALADGGEAEAEAGSQSATDLAVVTDGATGLVAAVAVATPFSLSTAVRLACTL